MSRRQKSAAHAKSRGPIFTYCFHAFSQSSFNVEQYSNLTTFNHDSKARMSLRKRSVSRVGTSSSLPTEEDPLQPTPKYILLRYEELPDWLKDNAYIVTAYRPASYSFSVSLLSAFTHLHNETVNIHTHLSPALVFLAVPTIHTSTPLLPFLPFYMGAAACLLISAFFHATSNHSPSVSRHGNQLDYVGILALITGSFVPSVYFGFRCHPGLQRLYWAMIGTLGTACGVVTVDRRFRTSAWRAWRAAMYVALGLSAVAPVTHGLRLYGWRSMEERIAVRWVLAQGALYILGAVLYAVSAAPVRAEIRLDGSIESRAREVVPGTVRCPRQLASDLSRPHSDSCVYPLDGIVESGGACACRACMSRHTVMEKRRKRRFSLDPRSNVNGRNGRSTQKLLVRPCIVMSVLAPVAAIGNPWLGR